MGRAEEFAGEAVARLEALEVQGTSGKADACREGLVRLTEHVIARGHDAMARGSVVHAGRGVEAREVSAARGGRFSVGRS
jgi:hypothetical protein